MTIKRKSHSLFSPRIRAKSGLWLLFFLLGWTGPAVAAIQFSPSTPKNTDDIYAKTSHRLGLTNVAVEWRGPTNGSAGCAPGRLCGQKNGSEYFWEHRLGRLPAGSYQVTFKADQCSNKICESTTLIVSPPCQPQPESCDGKDNDCNGLIDDGLQRGCYSGAANTKGVGPCKAGNQICIAGKWGACIGAVVPEAERCGDKVDNDCDGTVDETCECKTGEEQICYTGPPKTANVGLCKSGKKRCVSGTWTHCEGEQKPAAQEICANKIDDNCDGQVDENCDCRPSEKKTCYTGPPSSANVGTCLSGTTTCGQDGKWAPCTGEVLPKPENCGDGKDNDCDGQIDNGCGALEPPSEKASQETHVRELTRDGGGQTLDNTIDYDPNVPETSCDVKLQMTCEGVGKCKLTCPSPPVIRRPTGCGCQSGGMNAAFGWCLLFLLLNGLRQKP